MTDEERDAAVDELIAEWREAHDGSPLEAKLGLTGEQYEIFLVYGQLPTGYVPPNRDGHKSPAEHARNAIVHAMLAGAVALFLLWFFLHLGTPK